MSEVVSKDAAVSAALTAACSAASLLLLWQVAKRRQQKTPPSVGRYPVVGSHFHLKEPWPRSIYEQFGNEPVVLLHMGMEPVYVLNNWAAFKEAMIDNADAMTGRKGQFLNKKIFGDIGGISISDGEVWREYRRFTLRALREFGFGRREGEELIVTEADHLTKAIEINNGKPFNVSEVLSTATSNIICQLVFGSRLGSEDPNFSRILEVFRGLTQNENTNAINSLLFTLQPLLQRAQFLHPLFTQSPVAKKNISCITQLLDYCKGHRDKFAAEMDNVDKARNYIEAHLLHQKQQPHMFNDTRMAIAVADLFVAGTDTTSNTLRWAILLMIDNPSIAEKVRQEIHDQVGTERTATLADKQRLPYTLATIEEILRYSCLIHFGLFHRATQPITVSGYRIPTDATVAFNTYAINHDSEVFQQPMEFQPERHLRDGQFSGCEQIAAFGIGRRACLGEGLARSELLIFFCTIMQRFRFELDPNEGKSVWSLTKDPSLFKGVLMRAPPEHNIVFTRL